MTYFPIEYGINFSGSALLRDGRILHISGYHQYSVLKKCGPLFGFFPCQVLLIGTFSTDDLSQEEFVCYHLISHKRYYNRYLA